MNKAAEVEVHPTVLHIGTGSEFCRAFESESYTILWEPPMKIAEMTDISICYASEIHEPDILPFKEPKNVKEIHFGGMISQNNFDKLVQPLAHLQLLEIHLSSLEHLNLSRRMGFLFYLHLPTLESLQITSYNFTPVHTSSLKVDKIVSNCCCLLRKLFPNLNFLAVSLPLFRHRDTEVTESILKCVKLHRKTLKSLNVESTFDADKIIANIQLPPIPDREFDVATLTDVQLHSFHYFSTFHTETTEFWRKFLKTQKRLEYLQFWCGDKYYPLPTVLILHNFRNLHTISLNINPSLGTIRGSKRTSIDCAAFKKCSLLKTLVLKKLPPDYSSRPENSRKSDFTNFHLLPKGLEHIRLIHISLHKKDARIIAREMPQLYRLYLQDTGVVGDFGMAFEDLAYLLGKEVKVLHTIDIHDALNSTSFYEISTENYGGFATVARILYKTHKPQSFKAILNQFGEYDILEDEIQDSESEQVILEHEILHENFQGGSGIANYNFQEDSSNLDLDNLDDDEIEELFSDDKIKFQKLPLNQHEPVKPIELPLPSAVKYMSGRQNAIKHPGQPTIPEANEEIINSSNEKFNKATKINAPAFFTIPKNAQTETDVRFTGFY